MADDEGFPVFSPALVFVGLAAGAKGEVVTLIVCKFTVKAGRENWVWLFAGTIYSLHTLRSPILRVLTSQYHASLGPTGS